MATGNARSTIADINRTSYGGQQAEAPAQARHQRGTRVGPACPIVSGGPAVTSESPYVHLLFPYFSLTVPRLLTRGYEPHDTLVWVLRFACPAWGRGGLVLMTTKGNGGVSDMHGLHRQRFTAAGLALAAMALFVAVAELEALIPLSATESLQTIRARLGLA